MNNNIDPNHPPIPTLSISSYTDLSQDFSKSSIKQEVSDTHQCLLNTNPSLYSNINDEKSGVKSKFREGSLSVLVHNSDELSDFEGSPNSKAFENYSRKEKSLGELSKKFLTMFGGIDECVISLDKVTNQLGVERRRIYDIINILESLGVIYRKGKNHYQWKGLHSVHKTIAKLQRENQTKKEDKPLQDNNQLKNEESILDVKSMLRKEKYLSFLSTGFIKLFISWKNIISLEQAAQKLTSPNTEDNKIKTKIRRLYDIANVFSVLGIIKKTCLESKKPAFQWIGLPGLDNFIKKLQFSQEEKRLNNINRKINNENFREENKESPLLSKSIPLKHEEINASEEVASLHQNMLENFLVMLLHFCKRELQSQPISASHQDKSNLPPLQVSDSWRPENFSEKMEDYNYIMKREIEKIRINEMRDQKDITTVTLQDKTNTQISKNELIGFKRPPCTNINEYESKIFKRIAPLKIDESNEHRNNDTTKAQRKENFSQEVKIESFIE